MLVVMRAPVLARWMASTSSAVGAVPSASMSMTWPPIMPGGSGLEVADAAYAGADGEGDLAEDGDGGGGRSGKPRDGLEGEGLEGVAGEDGGGFAEDDVAGGLAAAEVVVVESGEVVVDEGVGVEHLEWRRRGRRRLRGCLRCLRPCGRLPCRGWDGGVCRRRRCCDAWRGGWSGGGCRVRAGGVRGRRR